jgi:biopolymer transport protein ExbD
MGAPVPRDESDGDDSEIISDINVTPFVDVMLVLLVIFMVAAPIMLNQPSIKVELPKAAAADETKRSPLALTLERTPPGDVQLYVNGEKSDETRLREVVASLVAKDKELQAIISADQGIAYRDVVRVVGIVKALGVRKFALNTDVSP